MEKISLKIAALYWLKLGLTSFGGPTGQISMMYEELVEKRKWIPEKKFLNALNFSMLLPGPEAQQLATYLGWYLHGRLGGLISGILFILPSFIFLVILSYLYINFAENYPDVDTRSLIFKNLQFLQANAPTTPIFVTENSNYTSAITLTYKVVEPEGGNPESSAVVSQVITDYSQNETFSSLIIVFSILKTKK